MDDPNDLVVAYQAGNEAEAYLVKNLLMEEQIEARVGDENRALTGLPSFQPEVFVTRKNAKQARAVIDAYEERRATQSAQPDWTCPGCGVTVVGTFDECDACGTSRPGA